MNNQGRVAARAKGELRRAAAQGGEADQRGGGGAPGGVEAGAAGSRRRPRSPRVARASHQRKGI